MDFNQNQLQNQVPYANQFSSEPNTCQPVKPANSLAIAALSLGILSLVFVLSCTVYPTLILGGLSIILALLSKGTDTKMHVNAKAGVVTAVAGIIVDIIIVIAVSVMLFSPYGNKEYREEFDKAYEQIYGESFDDMLKEIIGDM